ncbi:MAG: DUF934 domain-containing protein [Pseudomonadota bacterium]
MTQIVRDTGFHSDDWTKGFCAPEAANDCAALDLPSDADVELFHNRLSGVEMIRVDFPSFADGRGFTIAAQLRRMGFKGRLRAAGHVIADQYAMARRAGFDEVEISQDLAERQPEAQWLRRANWTQHNYQARLKSRVVSAAK